jgi:hypothetical protein
MDQSSDLCFLMPRLPKHCSKCWKTVPPLGEVCPRCRSMTVPTTCSLESRRGLYIGFLKEAKLDPVRLWAAMGSRSLNEIARNIKTAQEASTKHSCYGSLNCPLQNAFDELSSEVDTLVKNTKGLCLDCVKAGCDNPGLSSIPANESTCMAFHSQVGPKDHNRVPLLPGPSI